MSRGIFGWDLPPGVTDQMIEDHFGDSHDERCPAHEDAEPHFTECGGEGVCVCYADRLRGTRWFWRLRDIIRFGGEVCVIDADPDCACAEIADDDDASAAAAAEARAEARREF